MKDFYAKYRSLIRLAVAMWILFFAFFIVIAITSSKKAGDFGNELKNTSEMNDIPANWENSEIRELFKEKRWLEQQLELAKSDSFSMGINLKDSVVQVQLKGTILFQGKILRLKPTGFFTNSERGPYLHYFANIGRVDTSWANIPKKPYKKIKAPEIGQEVDTPAKADTVKEERIHWEMNMHKNLTVVINGVVARNDSCFTDIPAGKDIRAYRIRKGFKSLLSGKYQPVLFLWLPDNEAKAIYRALPEKHKCIFRN